MSIIKELEGKIKRNHISSILVYPEGWNKKIQEAAELIVKETSIKPLLIFRTKSEVPSKRNFDIQIIDETDLTDFANTYYELRKDKGVTLEQAFKIVKEPNFFATMLIYKGKAHGYVGGIEYTTADTMRPALQIIKTNKNEPLVSSAFIMEKGDERLIFSDCAINVNPTSEQLAMIAKQSVRLAKDFAGMDNLNTALLSFSTAGSAKSPEVDKVAKAYELLKDFKEAKIFGEMQFDSAYVDAVRVKKAPNLDWKERASIFIFPTLEAGNIGYKIAQRLGGYEAIGPILMGLAKPVNDLSRGASVEDVVGVSYITAVQTQIK